MSVQTRPTGLTDMLSEEIDRLRAELHRAYARRGRVDDQLLEISRRLDRVLLLYERLSSIECTEPLTQIGRGESSSGT
jgi:hypothetical protein